MKITDKEALHQLKLVKSGELEEMLDTYPEDERDGRSDLQMLADEAGYLYSLFSEDGTGHSEAYEYAREVLRETKNGTVMPVYMPSMRPVYKTYEVDDARRLINEYRRLGRLINRLAKMGIYSKWL